MEEVLLHRLFPFLAIVFVAADGEKKPKCPESCVFGYKCVNPQKGCEITSWFTALEVIGICFAATFLVMFLAGLIFCFMYACLPDELFRRVVHPKLYAEQKKMLKKREEHHRQLAEISQRRGRGPLSISDKSTTSRTTTGATTAVSSVSVRTQSTAEQKAPQSQQRASQKEQKDSVKEQKDSQMEKKYSQKEQKDSRREQKDSGREQKDSRKEQKDSRKEQQSEKSRKKSRSKTDLHSESS